MNTDIYGEIINGEDTYFEIAKHLIKGESVGIGWTDEDSTHFDIIFTLGIKKYGLFQGGIKANNLFVSILHWSSYGFGTDDVKLGGYIQEKLRLSDYDITGEKVKELVNGVIEQLKKKGRIMKKELIITKEDIELLKEMKENCLKSSVYDDEKRLSKANAITKFLNLLDTNKNQKKVIDKLIELNQMINDSDYVYSQDEITTKNLDILKEVSE